jgi:hypothetical protein
MRGNAAPIPKNLLILVLAGIVLSAGNLAAQEPQAEAATETEQLRAQIESMQRQLEQMQQQLSALEAKRDAEQQLADLDEPSPERVAELETRIDQLEGKDSASEEGIAFGGAVRLNYGWRDYDAQNKDRLGDFELELFRVNVSGQIGDVLLDAEWRRYNDFQAIHHAWIGYDFSEQLQMQLGITQVPFGILPYASHSFWFTGNYYLGYEDDYDTGLKLVHTPSDNWTLHYAFFKNPEYADDGRTDRYSFDLVTGGDQHNSETNQFNFRAERHLTLSDQARMDLGLSLQAGQIYNRATEKNGDRWAASVHMDGYYGPWNLRLQALRYQYNPENPDEVSDDFVQKGAFAFPFLIASEADVYTYSLSRSVDLNWGPVSGLNCYNEGTFIRPRVSAGSDSIQSVTGCSVAAGGLFAYFDWIAGKNMWFAGGDGIGLDATTAGKWRSRFNVNLGYYF